MEIATASSPGRPLVKPGPGAAAVVNLYWLPSARRSQVRLFGPIFGPSRRLFKHRRSCDLYHSALEIQLDAARYVIEMAPAWNERDENRGVVAEGSVGVRGAGRLRLFRYEIRCWLDGRIPDIDEAIDSPRCLSTDSEYARRILELVPNVPIGVWGRDKFMTGDMWNSNSLTSWLISRSGLEVGRISPPAGGRAPGWDAGLAVAARDAGAQPGTRPEQLEAVVR